jgi:hypothetical protein
MQEQNTFFSENHNRLLNIVIAYYPLKALSNILRILMEMEIRSRKAL